MEVFILKGLDCPKIVQLLRRIEVPLRPQISTQGWPVS